MQNLRKMTGQFNTKGFVFQKIFPQAGEKAVEFYLFILAGGSFRLDD
jgi:hypothetical protein